MKKSSKTARGGNNIGKNARTRKRANAGQGVKTGTASSRKRARVSGTSRKKTAAEKTAREKAVKKGKTSPSGKDKTSSKGILTQGREQNRMSMFLSALVVIILMVAVGINGVSLARRLRENNTRIRSLRQEIQAEDERAEDIEEYRRYTKTDAYIEEIAREKLGLIYEGETVFKEQK